MIFAGINIYDTIYHRRLYNVGFSYRFLMIIGINLQIQIIHICYIIAINGIRIDNIIILFFIIKNSVPLFLNARCA